MLVNISNNLTHCWTMCDKASECIISIMVVSVLVYKSFCNNVCICSHVNKANCCCWFCCLDVNVSQTMLGIFKTLWIMQIECSKCINIIAGER